MNLVDCSMVLEGGAIKGVFTSGALDYLMEQDFYTKYVVGVSAGACNAVDYVSKQIGRSKICFIPNTKEDRYIKKRNLFKGKPIYDMDIVFSEFPLERHPFDFDTYFESKMECEIVVANCITGKAEYLEADNDQDTFLKIIRASSSMPFFCDMVYLNDTPYLDGGMADSIPLKRAIEKGYKKHIVILTKNEGYRKTKNKLTKALSKRKYSDYPELCKLIRTRWQAYNKQMQWVEELEARGDIFVLRPEMPAISRLEQDTKKATDFYEHGYDVMKDKFEELKEYIKS